jgi:non-heme chloroperoxidase
MVKTKSNPGGIRKALADNRSQFFLDVASGPFMASTGQVRRFHRGLFRIGGARAWWAAPRPHYEGIKAFSETDQTDDLKAITVPTLVIQGDDDQVVPYKDAALLQAKLLKHGTLKVYPGYPHGMCTTNADVINTDILAFVRS